MHPIVLTFTSELRAPPEVVWEWMTSLEGISAEMSPLMKMTTPRGVTRLTDLPVKPGARLFRTWVLLFGLLPIDRSDLTLVSIEPGKGFVEESPMLTMSLWRHERSVSPFGTGTSLTDKLTFEPRFARGLAKWFIATAFGHRHRVLRRRLG